MSKLGIGDMLPATLGEVKKDDGSSITLESPCVIFFYPAVVFCFCPCCLVLSGLHHDYPDASVLLETDFLAASFNCLSDTPYLILKADTPGCTRQACGFRDRYNVFTEAGYRVYGASLDAPEIQTAFKNKFSMKYSLLSLTPVQLGLFGATKGDGVSVLRSHLVFDKDGKVLEAAYAVSPEASFERASECVKATNVLNAPVVAAAAAAPEEEEEEVDEDDKGSALLGSLLGGDIADDDDDDDDDFEAGEEEEDVEISDESGEEDAGSALAPATAGSASAAAAASAASAASETIPAASAAIAVESLPQAAAINESDAEESADEGSNLLGSLLGEDLADDDDEDEDDDFVAGEEEEDVEISDDSDDESPASKKLRAE